MKDQLPATGCGVNAFLQAFKPDASLLKISDRVNQVSQGSSQPVKPPDHQGVTWSQVGKCFLKPRPAVFCPADSISKDLLASCFLKGITLQIEVLIIS